MTHTYSLVSILRDDPDFSKRLEKKVKEVEQDRKNLLSSAEKYNKQFEQEIVEGTKLRQLLLSEGQASGLKEEQIDWGGKFLPTVRTPILNFLYFLLREESTDAERQMEHLRQRLEKERGDSELENYEDKDLDANLLYVLLSKSNLSNDEMDKVKDTHNKKYGHLQDEYDVEETELKVPQEMDKMMFEQMGHDLFKKLKKLKALSYSPVEAEAQLAHSKFLKLCQEYKIDPSRVP